MSLPVVDVAVVDLRSGNDLFYCAPYNCKLMAKKCVERQAKVAAGIGKSEYAWCDGCAMGAQVKSLVGEGPPLVEPEFAARTNSPIFQKRTKLKMAEAVVAPAVEEPAPVVAAPMEKGEPVIEEASIEVPAPTLPTKRLTLEKLEHGLAVWHKYMDLRNESDAALFEYTEFFGDHGLELICLAMAAIGRLVPQSAGKPYVPNVLSPKHKTVLATIAANPGLTRSDIADLMGVAYHRLKQVFPFLEQCGMITRKNDPIKAADVWFIAEVK